MPPVMLPATFVAVLHQFRPFFTTPSFENFTVLVAGFVHALGGHRITDALRAAGPSAEKHYTTYYRFFSRARWSLDDLGLELLGFVVAAFKLGDVELVLDDTLTRRTGKKVALATMHADPLLKQQTRGRAFVSYGHVFVVLAVHIQLPRLAKTGWALPLLFRLYQGPSRGGRDDSPSDVRRRQSRRRSGKTERTRVRMTDRELVDDEVRACEPRPEGEPTPEEALRKKTELGADLVLLVARRFPNLRFRLLADHLYNGRSVLHTVLSQVDNVHVVTRGRPDAALYEMPPERCPGQRGRPRVMGATLLNPKEWAEAHPNAFRKTTATMYGHDVTVLVASYLGMAYRSLPGRLLRYVIVKDPDGIYRTDYIISTDTSLREEEILASYSNRWPLERTFQDCKQKLCIENPQIQLPASVRRSVPFGMFLYSLVVLWYLLHGHELAAASRPAADPWYAGNQRPSFTDMIATLRRVSWAEGFADLPSEGAARQKTLAEYLARVVAAA